MLIVLAILVPILVEFFRISIGSLSRVNDFGQIHLLIRGK